MTFQRTATLIDVHLFCSPDIDECSTCNPCENGATCHNIVGSYYCTCADGFTGVNCENGK